MTLLRPDPAPPALALEVSAVAAHHFDLAITLAGVAIWQHDAASGRVHCNDLGWRLLGRPPQPQGRSTADLAALLHPDDLPTLRQQFELEALARPSSEPASAVGPVDLGARWRHADGQWRHLLTRRVPRRNGQGALVGHVGVALDMSDRFDQQQRALALAQRLEMATSSAGVGGVERAAG